MSSRRKINPEISPWLSAKQDNREKRFIQVGNSLLLSKKFQSLSAGAQHLYLCMAMESGGRREFLFPQSTTAKYGISHASFWRYVKELERERFLKVWSGKCVREPNRYAFCFDWKGVTPPATHLAIYSRAGSL